MPFRISIFLQKLQGIDSPSTSTFLKENSFSFALVVSPACLLSVGSFILLKIPLLFVLSFSSPDTTQFNSLMGLSYVRAHGLMCTVICW